MITIRTPLQDLNRIQPWSLINSKRGYIYTLLSHRDKGYLIRFNDHVEETARIKDISNTLIKKILLAYRPGPVHISVSTPEAFESCDKDAQSVVASIVHALLRYKCGSQEVL